MQNARRDPAKSLQHGFGGHATDFGIAGPWNKRNAALFQQAIEDHAASASVVAPGTFRGSVVVTRHFNPVTGLQAAFDLINTLLAGWKLYPSQIVIC